MGEIRTGLLVAIVLIVGACGGDGATGTGDGPSTASTVSSPTTRLETGSTRVDELGVQQVWVPSGTFLMGTVDAASLDPPDWAEAELASEQPQHEVELTRGYWIDTHEVTNEAFGRFVEAGGYADRALWSENGWSWLSTRGDSLPTVCDTDEPDHPRACVTWYEAEAYAAWRGGRLPTEAEWEYAARGPGSLIYPWGDEWDAAAANIVGRDQSAPVGAHPGGASWVGALDMSGNVMEWVSDWWSASYYGEAVRVDPTGPERGGRKVEKGGWFGSVPYTGRAAYRHFEDPPTYQDHHIGFRIVSPE